MKTLLIAFSLLFLFSAAYSADMCVIVDYSGDWCLEIWRYDSQEPKLTQYGTGHDKITISYEEFIYNIHVAVFKENQDDETIYLSIWYKGDNGPGRIISARTEGDAVSLAMLED